MMQPIWNSFSSQKTIYPELSSDLTVDLLILGGGITGVSVAQSLSGLGLNIALIEARKVGGGTTAHSTGNLYATTDKNLLSLIDKHGFENIHELVQARSQCINKIEDNIKLNGLDCDFKRTPWYLYTTVESERQKISDEFEISKRFNLPVEKVSLQYPYPCVSAMKMADQAQINGRLYVQQLFQTLKGCQVFENTQAHSVVEKDGFIEVTTNRKQKIKTQYLVHATHSPKGVKLLHTLLGPYREYGIAFKVEDFKAFSGIYWGYHGKENFISSRMYHHKDQSFVIVVGEPHKVGQQDNEKSFSALYEFAKTNFHLTHPDFQWGGQHYRPVDGLPFIGREKEGSNTFVATGYSTDGLVYGVLAGDIIKDLLHKKENRMADMLRPDRKSYLKGLKEAVKENANVFLQYTELLPHWRNEKEIQELKNGEARVIESAGKKIAVYKDENSELHCHSALCTHLKCVVHWNGTEKSWDCPCHGSRFDHKGCVIEGPALHNLHSVDVRDKQKTG